MKEIKDLLAITSKLKLKYGRRFTLDGLLVGDIGEVLAAEKYGLELMRNNSKKHDAFVTGTKKYIQIKSSFSKKSFFPCSHVPQYFLAIQILNNGDIIELFNGPGQIVQEEYIEKRKLKKGRNVYTLSGNILQLLNAKVPNKKKIKAVIT